MKDVLLASVWALSLYLCGVSVFTLASATFVAWLFKIKELRGLAFAFVMSLAAFVAIIMVNPMEWRL
jgi:hypothetical protein